MKKKQKKKNAKERIEKETEREKTIVGHASERGCHNFIFVFALRSATKNKLTRVEKFKDPSHRTTGGVGHV